MRTASALDLPEPDVIGPEIFGRRRSPTAAQALAMIDLFVEPLLRAQDPDELEGAFDDALTNPSVSPFVRLADACLPSEAMAPMMLGKVLTADQVDRFEEAADKTQILVQLMGEQRGPRKPSLQAPLTAEPDPLSMWGDLSVPRELSRCMLDSISGTLAGLALVYAAQTQRSVSGWLSEELLRRFESGVTACLQILGRTIDLPETLLPAAEQLDWSAIMARHREELLGVQAMALHAERTGGSLALAELPDED